MPKRTLSTAFTLSELLIAVAILGLIATFTIPKILNRVDFSIRKNHLKVTVASLQDILYAGIANNDFASPFRVYNYFAPKLNASKVCSSNAITEGCHSGETDISPNYWTGSEAFVMHSGAVIFTGYQPLSQAANSKGILVDLNGSKGPNKAASDQFVLTLCFGPSSCNCCAVPMEFYITRGRSTPGSIGPSGVDATSAAWEAIWN